MLNLFYRMKHNELSGIHCRIVHVCAKKYSVVKSRDAIGEKEEEACHSLWSVEGIPISPYSSPTDSPNPQHLNLFIFRAGNSLFLFNLFSKIQFYIFSSLLNYDHWVFRIVPECSGMFHVPDFIDCPSRNRDLTEIQKELNFTSRSHQSRRG